VGSRPVLLPQTHGEKITGPDSQDDSHKGTIPVLVSQVLRHKDIESTMRYVHIADDTRQAKYDAYLKL
jgi:hypothetical protein